MLDSTLYSRVKTTYALPLSYKADEHCRIDCKAQCADWMREWHLNAILIVKYESHEKLEIAILIRPTFCRIRKKKSDTVLRARTIASA